MLHGHHQVTALDLRHTGGEWAFAGREKGRIARHWEQLVAANPALWNGKVLLCRDAAIEEGCVRARFLTTDFASFVAWRDWGWPDKSICNCFGSAVVLSNDGALIYGRMSHMTLNPGLVYPPGGSLEPGDVVGDGTVDVQGSIERELAEETGLVAGEAMAGEWVAIGEGQRLALARAYRFDLAAAEIKALAERHIAHAEEEELEGIEVLRSVSQIDSRMPVYAAEIARYFLSGD